MDKTDHLMAEKNENNKDSQHGQVTPKKYFFKPMQNDLAFWYIHREVKDLKMRHRELGQI
jgi:hypothetical protein